ncbi:MAG: UvrD-helicase domain-containing protein [Elusimicrobia bacterium]|nr:UvrD-helicase domain-containing protein [Elusimicrobiota bacterium]
MNDAELDPSQRAAVLATDGPVVVAAGPGTGKTRVLAHRIAHLVRDQRVHPGEILAVTFTRSAAGEMRERIQALLPGVDLRALWAETCHAAALRILREEAYPFPEASVLGEEERAAVLEGVVPRAQAAGLLDEVRAAKQRLEWPQSAPARLYAQRLESRRLLDFDDLFLFALRLFEQRPEVLRRWRGRFRYVLMDEFQDTSLAQYRFAGTLAGRNFCVIGDPDQSIYGFAGSPFDPFAQFAADHPACRVLPLTENYRSQAVILDAAKQVIARNRPRLPRQLRARLERGLPIDISGHQSDRQEAELTARRIEGLLGGASRFTVDTGWAGQTDEGIRTYSLADIVILYRLNAQARLFETALERAGLPYVTYGKKTKKDGRQVPEAEDLEDFRDHEAAAAGDRITLMTAHRAKGLEFPVVFLTGCEDGVLPYRREGTEGYSIEEERRLFYVAMTRAKDRLFLSYAHKRFLFGKTLQSPPSPFVADIEEELRRIPKSEAPSPKRHKGRQPELF